MARRGTLRASPRLVSAGEPNVSPFGPSKATALLPRARPPYPRESGAGVFTFPVGLLLPRLDGRAPLPIALHLPRLDGLAVALGSISGSSGDELRGALRRSWYFSGSGHGTSSGVAGILMMNTTACGWVPIISPGAPPATSTLPPPRRPRARVGFWLTCHPVDQSLLVRPSWLRATSSCARLAAP